MKFGELATLMDTETHVSIFDVTNGEVKLYNGCIGNMKFYLYTFYKNYSIVRIGQEEGDEEIIEIYIINR